MTHSKTPIVFVHGFLGWGHREAGDERPYWHAVRRILQNARAEGDASRLTQADIGPLCFASVGPVSSTWDRACELFAQLRASDSAAGPIEPKYGHHHPDARRPSNPLRGILPPGYRWNANNPIHLVGHSQGVPTILLMQQLIASGFFDGVPRDAASTWIASITSISGAINGTTLPYASLGFDADRGGRLPAWRATLLKNAFALGARTLVQEASLGLQGMADATPVGGAPMPISIHTERPIDASVLAPTGIDAEISPDVVDPAILEPAPTHSFQVDLGEILAADPAELEQAIGRLTAGDAAGPVLFSAIQPQGTELDSAVLRLTDRFGAGAWAQAFTSKRFDWDLDQFGLIRAEYKAVNFLGFAWDVLGHSAFAASGARSASGTDNAGYTLSVQGTRDALDAWSGQTGTAWFKPFGTAEAGPVYLSFPTGIRSETYTAERVQAEPWGVTAATAGLSILNEDMEDIGKKHRHRLWKRLLSEGQSSAPSSNVRKAVASEWIANDGVVPVCSQRFPVCWTDEPKDWFSKASERRISQPYQLGSAAMARGKWNIDDNALDGFDHLEVGPVPPPEGSAMYERCVAFYENLIVALRALDSAETGSDS